jgi:hypothetical protein
MALFTDIEEDLVKEGKTPVSQSLQRAEVEAALISGWQGNKPSAAGGHGDKPHGDSHGDHTDAGGRK